MTPLFAYSEVSMNCLGTVPFSINSLRLLKPSQHYPYPYSLNILKSFDVLTKIAIYAEDLNSNALQTFAELPKLQVLAIERNTNVTTHVPALESLEGSGFFPALQSLEISGTSELFEEVTNACIRALALNTLNLKLTLDGGRHGLVSDVNLVDRCKFALEKYKRCRGFQYFSLIMCSRISGEDTTDIAEEELPLVRFLLTEIGYLICDCTKIHISYPHPLPLSDGDIQSMLILWDKATEIHLNSEVHLVYRLRKVYGNHTLPTLRCLDHLASCGSDSLQDFRVWIPRQRLDFRCHSIWSSSIPVKSALRILKIGFDYSDAREVRRILRGYEISFPNIRLP